MQADAKPVPALSESQEQCCHMAVSINIQTVNIILGNDIPLAWIPDLKSRLLGRVSFFHLREENEKGEGTMKKASVTRKKNEIYKETKANMEEAGNV